MNTDLSWKKVKEEKYRAGYRRMIKKSFILLNGKTADYDIKDEGNTVSCFALTKDNKVILTRVFRPGPEKLLLEMPGGHVDEDEDVLKAAKRELLEETGYSGEVEYVGSIIDDAYSNCIRNSFVFRNCEKVAEPTWEEDEECEIVLSSLDEFRNHLKSGQLTDVESGYLCLDHLNLL